MTRPIDALVATGDAGLRSQVTLALEGERFEVAVARDTDEAVQRIAARPPRVLLVDIDLEGRGALPLAAAVRRQPQTEQVRTLLLVPAGTSAPEDAPGVDARLAAPFTSLALLRKVASLV